MLTMLYLHHSIQNTGNEILQELFLFNHGQIWKIWLWFVTNYLDQDLDVCSCPVLRPKNIKIAKSN